MVPGSGERLILLTEGQTLPLPREDDDEPENLLHQSEYFVIDAKKSEENVGDDSVAGQDAEE